LTPQRCQKFLKYRLSPDATLSWVLSLYCFIGPPAQRLPRALRDLRPNFPPVKNRVLACGYHEAYTACLLASFDYEIPSAPACVLISAPLAKDVVAAKRGRRPWPLEASRHTYSALLALQKSEERRWLVR
jgi:hypothetical protein